MTQISEREACTKRSWYMGGGIGLLVAFLMLVFGASGLLKAIVVGALIAVIAGYLLMTLLCKNAPANAPQDNTRSAAAASVASAPTASAPTTPETVSSAIGTVPAGDAGIGAAERASGTVTPVKEEPAKAAPRAPIADTATVAEDTPAPKPTAAPVADTGKADTAAPVADTASVDEAPSSEPVMKAQQDVHSAATASLDETPEAPLPDTAPAPKPTATRDTGTASDASAAEQPALLDAPRAEGADDLKRIGGIGPKMEQTLNELGIYHFDQLANLTDAEIAWVDSRLRFRGRIERDNWVGQAKSLADASESQS
jgi:predicted flap endonuclease-1-like 5' DNA nuclease